MVYFEKLFIGLQNLGLLDVLLPLLFVFVVVYGVLEKTKVMGSFSNARTINAIIAFVVGFIFVLSSTRVAALNSILQKLVLLLIASVMVQIIFAAFGAKSKFIKSNYFLVLLFLMLVIVFSVSLGWFKGADLITLVSWVFSPVILFFAVFLAVLWFVMREPSKPADLTEQAENSGEAGAEKTTEIPKEELKLSPSPKYSWRGRESDYKGTPYKDLTEDIKRQ